MRKRILAIDDQPVNLLVLEGILRPLDCEVVRATSGTEALARVAERVPDLVLLDRRMPGLDGLDVLRALRTPPNPWIPVILVTADGDRESRLQGLEAGADDFIEKPVDRPVLLARVRTLLALREAQEALVARAHALSRLNDQRRDLVDFLVHDLKNPLAVVRTNLAFVAREAGKLSRPSQEALHDASYAAHRMTGLVLDLLTIERMEQTEIVLNRRPVDLGALALDVAQTHRREAELQSLTLRVEAAEMPASADLDLLRRVVENLVDNALHHTPQGGTIELRVERAPGPAVVVANSGTPIPEPLRPVLFEKYVRGDKEARGRFGLGLHFCSRIAAAHGGTIELVDLEPWAVAFRFALPVQ